MEGLALGTAAERWRKEMSRKRVLRNVESMLASFLCMQNVLLDVSKCPALGIRRIGTVEATVFAQGNKGRGKGDNDDQRNQATPQGYMRLPRIGLFMLMLRCDVDC